MNQPEITSITCCLVVRRVHPNAEVSEHYWLKTWFGRFRHYQRNVYNMAARGVQKWRDRVNSADILPVAWDRDNSSAEDSTPFCLTIKTIEGLIPKVDLDLINRKLKNMTL